MGNMWAPKALKAQGGKASLIAFGLVAVALYAYGVLSAPAIPARIEGIVLPLDFMVGIPIGFYLLVVRPRKLTPLAVIPVIWLGYGLSALALGSPQAGALPWLLAALVPVELAIAVRECLRIVRAFRDARAASDDPMEWLRCPVALIVRKEAPTAMAAAELSVWYYALFSWRRAPLARAGERTFPYHNAGGYMNMMLGLALAFPAEIIAVHLLLMQWNAAVAVAVTALSLYAVVWLVGDARARILRPVAVGGDAVRLECGIQMEAVIPLVDVEMVVLSEADLPASVDVSDRLNYGTFYRPDAWVVTKRPVEVRTLLGKKQVRAIGVSLDDPKAFAACVAAVGK